MALLKQILAQILTLRREDAITPCWIRTRERKCRTILLGRNNEHLGKKYWKCPQPKGTCTFHLWQEHEAKAKTYHKAADSPVPQTPTKPGIRSYLQETPTKLNGKRAAKDITNREANEEPAAKATRRNIFSTPGQQSTEKPKSGRASLPTPESRPHISTGEKGASRLDLLQSPDASPTPVRSKDTSLKPDDYLGAFPSVLELLRENGIELDHSALEMLRHLITSPVYRGA